MPRRPPPPAALPPRDPAHDVAGNHYWRYHSLDALMACKRPVTASTDEDLFIAVHQVCELCFHQMIVDLKRALDAFALALRAPADGVVGDTGEAVYFLRRVVALWRVANRAMPTLAGLRAFGEFRPSLGPSSGFQSAQFRHLEILAGVDGAWWRGGTRDAQGALHPAELAFEARHGDAIRVGRHAQADRDAIAAERVVAPRLVRGVGERAAAAGARVVIEDHALVEGGEIERHADRKKRAQRRSESARASISARVL